MRRTNRQQWNELVPPFGPKASLVMTTIELRFFWKSRPLIHLNPLIPSSYQSLSSSLKILHNLIANQPTSRYTNLANLLLASKNTLATVQVVLRWGAINAEHLNPNATWK